MRLEATVPDQRGQALDRLARELGLSRSQVVDEALSLFLKAVLEVRRGRRLVTLDPASPDAACELATPTLSALEWAANPVRIGVPAAAFAKMRSLAGLPPKPGTRLKAAVRRHTR